MWTVWFKLCSNYLVDQSVNVISVETVCPLGQSNTLISEMPSCQSVNDVLAGWCRVEEAIILCSQICDLCLIIFSVKWMTQMSLQLRGQNHDWIHFRKLIPESSGLKMRFRGRFGWFYLKASHDGVTNLIGLSVNSEDSPCHLFTRTDPNRQGEQGRNGLILSRHHQTIRAKKRLNIPTFLSPCWMSY